MDAAPNRGKGLRTLCVQKVRARSRTRAGEPIPCRPPISPSIRSKPAATSLSEGRSTPITALRPPRKRASWDFQLPVSMKVLLENLLRKEDGKSVSIADLHALAAFVENRGKVEYEIAFTPARVLMQDFTGVPAVVDLAAMRDAMRQLGADPAKINPLNPVDLVIDHSVMVDYFGTAKAFGENVDKEYERNGERYRFLRWGSSAFNDFRVVPAGHRHLPPSEPGVSGPDGVDGGGGRQDRRLSRHRGRHRQPHDDGQRPVRARLGRRRHRGGGGHARPADPDADPRSDRLQAHRRHAGRRHRHRPCADRHPDAAQEGRGGQVRGIFRPRYGRPSPSRIRPPSPTWPPNTAPPAASSPSARRRSTI